MESIAPNIFVKDIESTISYYKDLGFELVAFVPEEGDKDFAMMSCGKVLFLFQTFESLGSDLPEIPRQDGGSLLLYIRLTEIKQFYKKIKDKVNVLKGLEKTFYGATEFSILDLNGYILTFAEDES